MPYKKLLSVFELQALIDEHKDSSVFRTNRKGEPTVEPWLRELRFKQAWEAAEKIVEYKIDEQEFQACWKRTRPPRPKRAAVETPNTATFGGYRLRDRSALDRDKKTSGGPKEK